MTKIKMNGVEIDSQKTYNFKFIVDNILFGVSQLSSVKDKVLKDKCRGNALRADFSGEGKGTQWFIKGNNLIKYLVSKKNEEKNKSCEKTSKKDHKESGQKNCKKNS